VEAVVVGEEVVDTVPGPRIGLRVRRPSLDYCDRFDRAIVSVCAGRRPAV